MNLRHPYRWIWVNARVLGEYADEETLKWTKEMLVEDIEE